MQLSESLLCWQLHAWRTGSLFACRQGLQNKCVERSKRTLTGSSSQCRSSHAGNTNLPWSRGVQVACCTWPFHLPVNTDIFESSLRQLHACLCDLGRTAQSLIDQCLGLYLPLLQLRICGMRTCTRRSVGTLITLHNPSLMCYGSLWPTQRV